MDNVNVFFINFHNGKVKECVTKNEDDSYTVFIEASLSRLEQIEAYTHALKHIKGGDFEEGVDADHAEYVAHKKGGE